MFPKVRYTTMARKSNQTVSVNLHADSTTPRLTYKQQAFIREFLIDFNATKAAIRAGHSEHSATAIGHENLRKSLIKAEIDLRIAEQARSSSVSPEDIRREHLRLAALAEEKGQLLNANRALPWNLPARPSGHILSGLTLKSR
ncbi:MAG: terminase small subunit [bacterium]|nr:terminase small subunit [bacterium]